MPKTIVPITDVDKELLSQLAYALTFVSEDITSYKIDESRLCIEAELKSEEAAPSVTAKIEELVARYQRREFGLPTAVDFQQDRDLPMIDTWRGLLERKWVTEVGVGHVILRGPAARLMSLIDARAQNAFGGQFGAELRSILRQSVARRLTVAITLPPFRNTWILSLTSSRTSTY